MLSLWQRFENDDEKDVQERKRKHLEQVRQFRQQQYRPCLHDGCEECHGTGIKINGQRCVHMISCPCPKCSPTMMSV